MRTSHRLNINTVFDKAFNSVADILPHNPRIEAARGVPPQLTLRSVYVGQVSILQSRTTRCGYGVYLDVKYEHVRNAACTRKRI